jgi:hypothetical protein
MSTINVVLDKLTNKFHIVLGTLAQGALIFYHFKTGKDLGPGLVNSVYAFYAFLLGHAATYQKWPDSDQDHDGPK